MYFQLCGHCDKLLCDKALKEHRRLYFDDEEWIRMEECEEGSRPSSPFCVSPPDSDDPQLGSSSSGSLSHDSTQSDEEMSSDVEDAFAVTIPSSDGEASEETFGKLRMCLNHSNFSSYLWIANMYTRFWKRLIPSFVAFLQMTDSTK